MDPSSQTELLIAKNLLDILVSLNSKMAKTLSIILFQNIHNDVLNVYSKVNLHSVSALAIFVKSYPCCFN